MRYNRFEFETKPPLFRPPKYTGITLSLLSIFVLVSMLVVWEKMAKVADIAVLEIFAWEKSKVPLEQVRLAYQNVAPCILKTTYSPLAELSALPGLKKQINKTTWDIIFMPETPDLKFLHSHQDYDHRGVVAYYQESPAPSDHKVIDGSTTPLICMVNRLSKNHAEALRFVRFLKAPTKGQPEFAITGWTGVSEDHWDMSPELKIYAVQESKTWLNSYTQNFADKEGIELSVSFLEEKNMLSSLHLLSKANNKNYLPDLLSFPSDLETPSWIGAYYSEINYPPEIAAGKFSLFLRRDSPLLKTAQKFLQYLSEN